MANNSIDDQDVVFKGRLFKVRNIPHKLPDGKTKTYELIDIQNAITLLPMDEEKNVYLVQQYRVGSGCPLLELPAGKIETGEAPFETAKRELREEIGMDAEDLRLIGKFYMSPGYANEYMYCYLATKLIPSPLKADDDEFINVRKMSFNEFLEKIADGSIEDSKSLAALTLAFPFINQPPS